MSTTLEGFDFSMLTTIEEPTEIEWVEHEDLVRRFAEEDRGGVLDAAAFLDEHLPGWAQRVTEPLDMGSPHDCVLGQVFEHEEPPRRRLFGLLPPKRSMVRLLGTGYEAGLLFMYERGFFPRAGVFCGADDPWRAEIERRT